MASDADYESFLNKANDQSSSTAQTSSEPDSGFKALKMSDASAPSKLAGVDEHFYVSDADYPFEAVAYSFSGSLDKGKSELQSPAPLYSSRTLCSLG